MKRFKDWFSFKTNLGVGSPVRDLPTQMTGEPLSIPLKTPDTLRTRIPILMSQLFERGVTLTIEKITPTEIKLFAHLYAEGLTIYVAQIPFEAGVHGANAILLERHLILALEYYTAHSMNKQPKVSK